MFETEEYVTHCAIDITRRRFTLMSSEASIKDLTCEDADQFIRVLNVVRASLDEDQIVYV